MKCFFTWQPVNDITSCFLLNGIFTLDCEMSVQNWVRWRSADAVAVNDLECRHKCCVMCCGSRRVSPLWVFAYFIPTVGWSNSWAVTCLPLCPRWSNGQFPLTLTGQPNRNFPLITLSFLWFYISVSLHWPTRRKLLLFQLCTTMLASREEAQRRPLRDTTRCVHALFSYPPAHLSIAQRAYLWCSSFQNDKTNSDA